MAQEQSADRRSFVTSSGEVLEYRGVSEATMQRIRNQVRADYKARGEVVDPPTYAVGQDRFEHDAESIADPKTTAEEREQWDRYQATRDQLERDQRRAEYRARLYRGIVTQVPDAWLADMAALGLAIPADPVDLKLMWLEDVLISVEDWAGINKAIAGVALEGAGDDAIQAVEDMFQRAMGDLGRSIAERTGAAAQGRGPVMVSSSAARDPDDHERVGDPVE